MSALKNWQEEKSSAYLYNVITQVEPDPMLRRMFSDLGTAANKQADIWAEELRKTGLATPSECKPNLRTRIVALLVGRLGARAMRRVLAAMKVRGMSVYSQASLAQSKPQTPSDISGQHKSAASGANMRAAVFGVNDGLLSNASLMMGMAGATPDPHILVLTGLAGLLAGAFAMASGEYVSVRSQREIYEYQIALERAELARYPEEEAAELALIYEARGLGKEEAQNFAKSLIGNPERAMDVLTRDELGLNPEELGSPWNAAIFSFLSFAVGAFVPLLPFLFGTGDRLAIIAIALTGASLFGVGASLSLFTGRGAFKGGLRMLLIGLAATSATYFIGKFIGVNVA